MMYGIGTSSLGGNNVVILDDSNRITIENGTERT